MDTSSLVAGEKAQCAGPWEARWGELGGALRNQEAQLLLMLQMGTEVLEV